MCHSQTENRHTDRPQSTWKWAQPHGCSSGGTPTPLLPDLCPSLLQLAAFPIGKPQGEQGHGVKRPAGPRADPTAQRASEDAGLGTASPTSTIPRLQGAPTKLGAAQPRSGMLLPLLSLLALPARKAQGPWYSLRSSNQSKRIKGDNKAGESSLQRRLGTGPKRIYLSSFSPEREKILPAAPGPAWKQSGGNPGCAPWPGRDGRGGKGWGEPS